MASSAPVEPLHVAIIGGGITGINLALGLQARSIRYTIFERAVGFREIGAGLGFSPNAERAMTALDPALLAAYKRVANPNGEDYFQWVDGCSNTNELIYKLFVGKDGFQGCRRSDYLEEVSKLVGQGFVKFGKEVKTLDQQPSGKMRLVFTDGSAEEADVVVGCDGIRSRVRQLILPEGDPAAKPHYTNKFCFRALIPMDKATAALGEERTSTRFMYNGPGAHVITYPIGMGTVLNVLAVLSDENPWQTADGKHTAQGSKQEAVTAFAEWGPTVRAIIDLLPDEMDKWAVFDMKEHPASTYSKGQVCLAGDAAHAVGPHLGCGAGLGIEDALALSSLLDTVHSITLGSTGAERDEIVRKALLIYNNLRQYRTRTAMEDTRAVCDLFQWRDAQFARDPKMFGEAITAKFHTIWDYDLDDMVRKGNKLVRS
ncbi:FAD/NAD(P)-binding domain-containing protein [Thozetella sp. PMI_491]|nr:FAD/NAD(P)-binding domain-containing protein [Thozetella sp. PMI_491]